MSWEKTHPAGMEGLRQGVIALFEWVDGKIAIHTKLFSKETITIIKDIQSKMNLLINDIDSLAIKNVVAYFTLIYAALNAVYSELVEAGMDVYLAMEIREKLNDKRLELINVFVTKIDSLKHKHLE